MPVVVALIPPPSDPSLAALAFGGGLGEGWTVHAYPTQDDVPDEVAAHVEFVVPAPPVSVDGRLFSRAPRLRLVQVPGHGFDHVDLAAAATAGVPVATVASSGAEAHTVAEMTILLAGVASRRILHGDRLVRGGQWGNLTMLQGGVFELAGKTIGLIGLGRVGREVAKRARAFDMRALYYDIRRPGDEAERDLGIEYRALDALLAESDVVSLHAPLTAATRGLIDERAIGLMKPTAVLVNTARGALVDAEALGRALATGRIRAAALDVFDPEPPSADLALLTLDGVVLSPHMAGVTAESIMRIIAAALENCRRVARGDAPWDRVVGGGEH